MTLCEACHTATHNRGVDAPTAEPSISTIGLTTDAGDADDEAESEAPSDARTTSWSERHGRWWIHVLLLVLTLGIRNLVYWTLHRLHLMYSGKWKIGR